MYNIPVSAIIYASTRKKKIQLNTIKMHAIINHVNHLPESAPVVLGAKTRLRGQSRNILICKRCKLCTWKITFFFFGLLEMNGTAL